MTTKWKLVPVEPTLSMCKAGIGEPNPGLSTVLNCQDALRRALAAAPDPTHDEALVELIATTIVWRCVTTQDEERLMDVLFDAGYSEEDARHVIRAILAALKGGA